MQDFDILRRYRDYYIMGIVNIIKSAEPGSSSESTIIVFANSIYIINIQSSSVQICFMLLR